MSTIITDTTSLHDQHVFDINCNVCSSKRSSKSTSSSRSNRPKLSEIVGRCLKFNEVTPSGVEIVPVVGCDASRLDPVDIITASEIYFDDDLSWNEMNSEQLQSGFSSNSEEAGIEDEYMLMWNTSADNQEENAAFPSPIVIPSNSPGVGSELTDPRDPSRLVGLSSLSLGQIKAYSSNPESNLPFESNPQIIR